MDSGSQEVSVYTILMPASESMRSAPSAIKVRKSPFMLMHLNLKFFKDPLIFT